MRRIFLGLICSLPLACASATPAPTEAPSEGSQVSSESQLPQDAKGESTCHQQRENWGQLQEALFSEAPELARRNRELSDALLDGAFAACERGGNKLVVEPPALALWVEAMVRVDFGRRETPQPLKSLPGETAVLQSLLAHKDEGTALLEGVETQELSEVGRARYQIARFLLKGWKGVGPEDFQALGEAVLTLQDSELPADVYLAKLAFGGFLPVKSRIGFFKKEAEWARSAFESPLPALIYLNRLAVAYDIAGQGANALALNKELAGAFEAAVGPEHIFTLRSLSNLAVNLSRAGQTDDALTLQLEVLARRERTNGDPSGLAVSHESVAVALQKLGRFPEALEHCEKSVEIRRARLASDHPDAKRGENCVAAVKKQLAK